MGNAQAKTLAHAYSVRVSIPNPKADKRTPAREQWQYLQYVRPAGEPHWTDECTNYISRLESFSTAQRVCREVVNSAHFPQGTRVQFYKQLYQPTRNMRTNRLTLQRVSEHKVRDSTMYKP
jgi:hypothetical protein